MVEEMKYQKKEKRKHFWRCLLSAILTILLEFGYLWELDKFNYTQVSVCGEWADEIIMVLLMVSLLMLAANWFRLYSLSKKHMEKNVREFKLDTQIDEILAYLEDKEIELKLNFTLNDTPVGFKKCITKTKPRFYARKKGPRSLYIWASNKGRKIWDYDIISPDDYNFFFRYFEPYETK